VLYAGAGGYPARMVVRQRDLIGIPSGVMMLEVHALAMLVGQERISTRSGDRDGGARRSPERAPCGDMRARRSSVWRDVANRHGR